MSNSPLLGPWVRRFLLEYLVSDRNLARNTQRSYRDTLRLLLPFLAHRARKGIDRLATDDLTHESLRLFLKDLEDARSCGVTTRNQRLAAIRSFAKFISLNSPEQVAWYGAIQDVPFKKAPHPMVTYLEKSEMDALLVAPDRRTDQGRRDYVVLLFLYNTGARADEVAHAMVGDLEPPQAAGRNPSSILIHGKGNKVRRCPLWSTTSRELMLLVNGRDPAEHIFINRYAKPLTRFGIHALVERYATRAAAKVPSLSGKRVSPHVIRHTTATHLLRAGVDINTIRAWLGHASLVTTNVYAEVDLEMKAKALSTCEMGEGRGKKPWRANAGLMDFLRSL